MSNPNGRLIHGHKRGGKPTRIYRIWQMMLARCYTPSCTRFEDWGGKGIRVCSRWHRFENFLADMGEPPSGTSIDRYPNKDGNYEPGNCRWATPKEQARNRHPRRKRYHHSCAICEKEFNSIMQRAMYCSPHCHSVATARQARERRNKL